MRRGERLEPEAPGEARCRSQDECQEAYSDFGPECAPAEGERDAEFEERVCEAAHCDGGGGGCEMLGNLGGFGHRDGERVDVGEAEYCSGDNEAGLAPGGVNGGHCEEDALEESGHLERCAYGQRVLGGRA